MIAADIWKWQAHPEVWVLIVGLLAIGYYAVHDVEPKAVAAGFPKISRAQKTWYFSAVMAIWIVSDWPVHDIAEQYLFSVHMIQHSVYIYIATPMLLLATPEWFAETLLGKGKIREVARFLSRPLVAGGMAGALTLLSHWSVWVNYTIRVGPAHFLAHLLIILVSLFMWMPVCSPIRAWRSSLAVQMMYLFFLSFPTIIPAAWLTVAEKAAYSGYDKPFRPWDITVVDDQQYAAWIMKVLASYYTWVIIAVLFARMWKLSQSGEQYRGRLVPSEPTAASAEDTQEEKQPQEPV